MRKARELAQETPHPLRKELRGRAALEAFVDQTDHAVVEHVANASSEGLEQTQGTRRGEGGVLVCCLP